MKKLATSADGKSSKFRLQTFRCESVGRRLMRSTLSVVTQVVGAATLLFVGYTLLAALPDIRRYIKISSM
jgi:hypothetical protein